MWIAGRIFVKEERYMDVVTSFPTMLYSNAGKMGRK
jgi:hypothetical protein